MKVAVCAKHEGLDSKVDDRFGRCEKYVIFDTETSEVKTINNDAKDQPSGAGGQAVRLLNTHGTEIIIAPELGPKAVTAIEAFEIKAYIMDKSETVQEVINSFVNGNLIPFNSASVESHSGFRKV